MWPQAQLEAVSLHVDPALVGDPPDLGWEPGLVPILAVSRVGALERLHALRYALAAILTFVGTKLLLSDLTEIPNWASLAVVIGAVLVAIVVSTPERRGQRA